MKKAVVFPTDILMHSWPDSQAFNKELKRVILENKDENPGIVRSNTSGWHSESNILKWDEPIIRDLQSRIIEMSKAMVEMYGGDPKAKWLIKAAAWANVNDNLSYNIMHSHPNCVFSGVYYVCVGKPNKRHNTDNGTFEFLDPRPTGCIDVKGLQLWQRARFTPAAGGAMMFPSWVWHCVHPFIGKGDRISVAFNVDVKRADDKD